MLDLGIWNLLHFALSRFDQSQFEIDTGLTRLGRRSSS